MKKLLVILVAVVFCATSAMADDDKSSVFTIRAGVNMMSNNLLLDNVKTSTGIGYDAALGGQFGKALYFGVEVGAKTRGWKYDEGDKHWSGTAHSIYVAPSVGYKIGLGEDIPVKIAPHAGVYAGFDLSSSCDDESFDDISAFNDYSKFSAGVRAGASIWISKVFVDVSYDYDFTSIFKVSNGSITQKGIVISLGVGF